MGIVPVWGYQLAIAIALAYLFRLNKVIVIVTANISIPPMIPIILYASYSLGGLILQDSSVNLDFSEGIDFEFVKNNLYQYLIGSVSLAVLLSVFLSSATYFMLKIFRDENTVNN